MNQFEAEIKKKYERNIQSCLVIHRNEVPRSQYKKEFKDIDITSLTTSMKPIAESPFVIFIDKDGSTKLLKNRYGMNGVVVSEKQYADYLRLLKKEVEENRQIMLNDLEKLEDENNKLNSRTQKKSFLARIFGK